MLSESILTYYEETADKLANDDSCNSIGKLNLAAFLGERAYYMLADIHQLQRELDLFYQACAPLIKELESGSDLDWHLRQGGHAGRPMEAASLFLENRLPGEESDD